MENPYQNSPASNPSINSTQSLVANQSAIYQLSASKGWVRFISVLMFISFAFFLLALIGMFAIYSRVSSSSSGELGLFGTSGAIGIIIILLYGVIVFMLGLRLSKFSSAIGRLAISRNPLDLESAMVQQMKFWRLCGIIVLIGLIFAILSIALPSLMMR